MQNNFHGLKVFLVDPSGGIRNTNFPIPPTYDDFLKFRAREEREFGSMSKLIYENYESESEHEITCEASYRDALSYITSQGLFLQYEVPLVASLGPWRCFKCSFLNPATTFICEVRFCQNKRII